MGEAQGQRCAIYSRVSSRSQTVENQTPALVKMAQQRGFEVAQIYQEIGSGRKDRPLLSQMIRDAHRAEFDVIIVWALDRLDRRMLETVQLILRLDGLGVRVVSHEESWLDTTGPARNLLLAVAAWVLEAEVDRVRARTKAGLEQARRRGIRLGRPPVSVDLERLVALRGAGLSIRQIGRELEIGGSTVHRLLRAHETLDSACSKTGPDQRPKNLCASAQQIASFERSQNQPIKNTEDEDDVDL